MKFRILSSTEKRQFGADVVAILDYTDVAAGGAATAGSNINVVPGTSGGIVPAAGTSGIDVFPSGNMLELIAMRVTTEFVSSSAAGLTVKVGDSASATRYLAATQIQAGQTPVDYATGVVANQPFMYSAVSTANNQVLAVFTSTTANLNTFTAGELSLYFSMQDVNQLPSR